MANVAGNVLVAVTGGVRYAPLGTALPTSPAAALNVALLDVGYIAESGVDKKESTSDNKIKAWQNADVVRTMQTEHGLQFALSMIETNANSLGAYWGGNYTAGVAQIKGGSLPHKVWVLDVIDGTNLIRYVVPDGQIVERGDISHVNGDAIMYPIVIECYPDAAGVKAYVYYTTSAVSA